MRRDIFHAIADPTRRAIIALILTQAMTPNALAEKFGTSRQAVSKHIKVLRECGLITNQQIGREIYYKMEPKKLKALVDWIESFRQGWENNFVHMDAVLDRLKKEKHGQ